MYEPKHGVPKYHQLKEFIRDQIRRGELTPGQQLPTENILAQQFQLSRHTVRKALGDLEKEGWISREQGRGTFVTDQATNKIGCIAVVIKSITNFIFPEIVRGMAGILSEAKFEMKMFLTGDDPELEGEYLKQILSRESDGVIIEPAQNLLPSRNLKYFREFERRRIPYLMIHSYCPELDPAYVVVDDCLGGYLATQYLLQLGHQRIAGIFNIDVKQGIDRQAGYKKALLEYGVQPLAPLIGQYQYRTEHSRFPFQFTQELLSRPEPPTAIFCYNDLDAIRVLDAVRQAGLKVPEDISIIGYNDSSLATVSEVKLTSVKHPKTELGREAASFMVSMVKRRIEKPKSVIVPELIIRSSCGRIVKMLAFWIAFNWGFNLCEPLYR
jgi:GntR family transcriptional regulator of arabinose operon